MQTPIKQRRNVAKTYKIASNNLDKSTSTIEDVNKTKKNVNSNKIINYDLFLESLAITALTMKCVKKEYTDVQKVINSVKIDPILARDNK